MYRLNVQVTAYGRQTVPDRGVVRSCDPLQNFGGWNIFVKVSNHWQNKNKISVVGCRRKRCYSLQSFRPNLSISRTFWPLLEATITGRFDFQLWNFVLVVFCSNHSSKTHRSWAKGMGSVGIKLKKLGGPQPLKVNIDDKIGGWIHELRGVDVT